MIKRHTIFFVRKQVTLLGLACLWIWMEGCAVVPKQLTVTDLSRSFEKGAIISARTGGPVPFEELLADLSTVQVVYVGEEHTNRAHHRIQLKILRALMAGHPQLSVGMEMFDRSYQHVLDRWSRGEVGREAFLRMTHWYANWRYDFDLYAEILETVRQNHLPLVALNLPFYIPPKIRVGGIRYLSNYEKQFLPAEIDTSNRAHRQYLEKVFREHHFRGKVKFKDFYLAQCAWEDTMAESVARHLDDGTMLVLAGNGHIRYKYGIPQRAFRRTGAPFRTIYLAAAGSRVELAVADYIWVAP